MERIGASGLGASGVVDENMAKRVRGVVEGVSEYFVALEGALVDVEAVPTSVKELLGRGKVEIDEMVSGDESEIPDHARQEGAADSLWSSKGRDAFRLEINKAVAKIRGERVKEFQEERFKDFSEGRSGVWFQKSKESKARVLNQVPVGGV